MNNFIEQMQTASKILPKQRSWLNELREESMKRLVSVGFPTRKQENWKYTNIHNLTNQQFQWAVPPKISFTELKSFDFPCYNVVLANGRYCKELSDFPYSVEVLSLIDESHQNAEMEFYALKEKFDKFQQFALLNTALLRDGILIKVMSNTVLDKPLRILSIWKSKTVQMNHGRLLVFLGDNVKINIIEEYQSLGSELYFNNIVTKYILNENVKLNYIKLQNENVKAYHIANTQFQCASHSSMNSLHIGKGSILAREDISCELKGREASCRLYGLYLPIKNQHIDFHTSINHHVDHTQSDELFKGVIVDKSSAVFNGRVFVAKDAQKVQANQYNKNILLSEIAEVYTKPELEIYADDVKCSHGATIGQLDKEALFYLRSRGIPLKIAEEFLLEAFMDEVLVKVVDKKINEYVKRLVNVYRSEVKS